MSMTTLEQRIAIAEWMGWKWWKHTKSDTFLFCEPSVSKETLDDGAMKWECCERPEEVSFVSLTSVPNYPEDLNACAEFECRLRQPKNTGQLERDDFAEYGNELERIMERDEEHVWHATAAQRCEAFCRMQWPDRWQGGRE